MADLLQQLMSVLAPARPDPALATSLFAAGGGQLPPGASPAAGMPLPMRRPQASAPPLPMRNPGGPVPPMPMRNPQQNGAPPLPMQRPEPPVANAPPPVRRPGQPNVPGIMVDNAGPGGDLVSELRRVFGAVPTATGMNPQRVFDGVGGPAQGTPQPAIPQPAEAPQTASIGPFETTVTPAGSGSGITGKDVAGFFRNLARGAAGVDPTQPGLTAFAQGMAGSMVGMDKEAREAAAAEAAGEDREFERRMKTTDARLKQSKEQREARSAEIQNTKLVTEIMNNLDPGLTKDQKFTLRRDLMRVAGDMRANNPYMKDDEMKAALETIVRTADEQMNTGQPQGSAGQPRFQEGDTATHKNGQRIIFRGGQWQPLG